jgi:hypothetical protein
MMPQSRFYNIGTNVNYFIKNFFSSSLTLKAIKLECFESSLIIAGETKSQPYCVDNTFED